MKLCSLKIVILSTIFTLFTCFYCSLQCYAVSIKVAEGGLPIVSAEELMNIGIKQGSEIMLRRAWENYEKAININKSYKDGYLKLGRIFFHLSLLGKATEEDIQKINLASIELSKNKKEETKTDDSDVHWLMGLILAGQGKYLDALNELRLALALRPGNEFIICDLAYIHLALKQPKDAINLLTGINAKDGWTYFLQGLAWLQLNQKGKAIINFMKAQKHGFSGYWLNLALNKLSVETKLNLLPK